MKLNGSSNVDWLRPTFLLSTDLFKFEGQLDMNKKSKLIENSCWGLSIDALIF